LILYGISCITLSTPHPNTHTHTHTQTHTQDRKLIPVNFHNMQFLWHLNKHDNVVMLRHHFSNSPITTVFLQSMQTLKGQ
jgi:hypothetical protein